MPPTDANNNNINKTVSPLNCRCPSYSLPLAVPGKPWGFSINSRFLFPIHTKSICSFRATIRKQCAQTSCAVSFVTATTVTRASPSPFGPHTETGNKCKVDTLANGKRHIRFIVPTEAGHTLWIFIHGAVALARTLETAQGLRRTIWCRLLFVRSQSVRYFFCCSRYWKLIFISSFPEMDVGRF